MHAPCIRKCELMKMEVEVVEHKRGVGHVNGKVTKKKKVRRILSSSKSNTTANMKLEKEFISISFPLQQVYKYCKTLFKGPGIVPPPQDVHNFCNLLDTLIPEDFGLNENLPFFKRSCVQGNPRATYTTVYKCQKFSLVLFFLPAGAVIPLHNHPLMTVFSKLLLGKMHIKAYDWVDSEDVISSKPLSSKLARLKVNSTFTAPCNASVLFPTSGGNIHEFTAITPCAVLDVLGPPYSKEDGRDGSYYKEILFPFSDEKLSDLEDDAQSYGLLEEIEMPENAKMDGIMYLGPQIIESAD